MGTRRNSTTIAAALAALLISAILAGPANAAWPGGNGRIVAVEPRYDWESCPEEPGGHCDAPASLGEMIVSQRRDGSNPIDLAVGNNPTWDADGRRIAFQSASYAIWKINADGTGKRRLTSTQAEPDVDEFIDTFPAWSPTGARVAFQRTSDAGNVHNVMVVDVAPLPQSLPEPVQVTTGTQPEWSSRGKIAFLDGLGEDQRIYTVRPDGDERAAVPHTRGATDLTWGPGGRRLAFLRPDPDGGECLNVVNIDGTEARTVACGFRGAEDRHVEGIAFAADATSILVGVADFFDEPAHFEASVIRVLLDGTKRQMDVVGYTPDWQPR